MKRFLFPILFSMGLAVVIALPAAAQSEFKLATADVNQSGFLITSFKELGVSPGAQVVYTFSATASATYACLPNNYSVNHKKLSKNEEIMTTGGVPLSGQSTLTAAKHGTVSGGMALPPPGPPQDLVCSPGYSAHLVMVSYWGVSLFSSNGGAADLTGNCASDGCKETLLTGK